MYGMLQVQNNKEEELYLSDCEDNDDKPKNKNRKYKSHFSDKMSSEIHQFSRFNNKSKNSDKDGCLTAITQESKLQTYKIRRYFATVIRNRKRGNDDPDSNQLDFSQNLKSPAGQDLVVERENKIIKLTNDFDIIKEKGHFSNSEFLNESVNEVNGEDSDLNRDSATFRYRNGSVEIVNDAKLSSSLSQSPNHPFWRDIYSIHACVKSKIGLGTAILVTFIVPYEELRDEITYDFNKFNKELNLVNDYLLPVDQYCLKQCYKIAFYLSKMYFYEIIKMDCTFLKDSNGKIWLYYISDLFVREINSLVRKPFWMKNETSQEELLSRIINAKYSENMYIQDLNFYSEKNFEFGSKKVHIKDLLQNAMFHQFTGMMKDLDLSKNKSRQERSEIKEIEEGKKEQHLFVESPFYSSDDEEVNDKAFHELRPKQKERMKDFLLDCNLQAKIRVQRFYSALPKNRRNAMVKTNRNNKQKIKIKQEMSVQESNKSELNKEIINVTKGTERNLYNRSHIKRLHQQYQLKRLGSQQKIIRQIHNNTMNDISSNRIHIQECNNAYKKNNFRYIINQSNSSVLKSPVYKDINSYSSYVKGVTECTSQRINKTSDSHKVHRIQVNSTESKVNESQNSNEFMNISDLKSKFHKNVFKTRAIRMVDVNNAKILSASTSYQIDSQPYTTERDMKKTRNYSSKVNSSIISKRVARNYSKPKSRENGVIVDSTNATLISIPQMITSSKFYNSKISNSSKGKKY